MATATVETTTSSAVTASGYDELAYEFWAIDCTGWKFWGRSMAEAEGKARKSSHATWQHLAKCPEDAGLLFEADAADDAEMYNDLSHGLG